MLAAPFKFKKNLHFFHSCHKKWESFPSHKSLSSLPFLYTKILIKFKNWLKMFILGFSNFDSFIFLPVKSHHFREGRCPFGVAIPSLPSKMRGKMSSAAAEWGCPFCHSQPFLGWPQKSWEWSGEEKVYWGGGNLSGRTNLKKMFVPKSPRGWHRHTEKKVWGFGKMKAPPTPSLSDHFCGNHSLFSTATFSSPFYSYLSL